MLDISSGIDDIGGIQWELVIYLLVGWLLTFFCLFKGVKTAGKVVYITTVAPYIILLVLLVRAITLPGSLNGLLYLITPRWEKLFTAKVCTCPQCPFIPIYPTGVGRCSSASVLLTINMLGWTDHTLQLQQIPQQLIS
jgi:hypothetical protein